MNWAFSAILFILFVFPGLSFRIAYLSSPYGKRKLATSIADEVVFALLPAFAIQAFLRWFINAYISPSSGWMISPSEAVRLISPEKASAYSVTYIDDYFSLFIFHLFASVALGTISGWICRRIVRRYKFDTKLTWLRTENKWYYIFSIGERINFTFIDALVKTSKGEIIYTGTLSDFDPGPLDSLEGIYIDNVRRRLLENDRVEQAGVGEDVYYSVPGDSFYIPFSSIVNLNIRYFVFEESQ